MSLFSATLYTGICLVIFSVYTLFYEEYAERLLKAFPRSRTAAISLMAIAIIWFSFKIYSLGPADFGNYKNTLLVIFLSITLLSFYYVPDFLSVRALAGIFLLISDALLGAAFLQEPSSRLFLVTFTYFLILFAFVIGASPYLMRDLINWSYAKKTRIQILSLLLLGYGITLIYITFNYNNV